MYEIIAEFINKANSLGTVKLAAVWVTSLSTIFACELRHAVVQYLSGFCANKMTLENFCCHEVAFVISYSTEIIKERQLHLLVQELLNLSRETGWEESLLLAGMRSS